MEFILGIIFTWWFFGGLCIFALFSVHNEYEVFSFLSVLGLGTLAYFLFNLQLATLGWITLAYIPIGLGWSIWRWRKHCKTAVEDHNSSKIEYWGGGSIQSRINPSKNIGKIVNWVFIWPFSLLETFISDLIDAVEDFIKNYLIKIYENISSKYADQIIKK